MCPRVNTLALQLKSAPYSPLSSVRRIPHHALPSLPPQYHLEAIKQSAGRITGQLAGNGPPLSLEMSIYTNGIARMRVVESNPLHVRWETKDVIQEEKLILGTYTVVSDDPAGTARRCVI